MGELWIKQSYFANARVIDLKSSGRPNPTDNLKRNGLLDPFSGHLLSILAYRYEIVQQTSN